MRDEERGSLIHPSSLIPHPFKFRKEEAFPINYHIPIRMAPQRPDAGIGQVRPF
jgi:hypothetical protein